MGLSLALFGLASLPLAFERTTSLALSASHTNTNPCCCADFRETPAAALTLANSQDTSHKHGPLPGTLRSSQLAPSF
jgi:hypothetical protein